MKYFLNYLTEFFKSDNDDEDIDIIFEGVVPSNTIEETPKENFQKTNLIPQNYNLQFQNSKNMKNDNINMPNNLPNIKNYFSSIKKSNHFQSSNNGEMPSTININSQINLKNNNSEMPLNININSQINLKNNNFEIPPTINYNSQINLKNNNVKMSDDFFKLANESVLTTNFQTNVMKNNTIDDLNIGEDDDDEEGDDHQKRLSTFSEYKPMKFKFGKSHPDQVVETSSMSVVEPPDLTYNLRIIDEILDSGSLSSLQMEAIAYACQMHEKFLETDERAAFFLGFYIFIL